MSKNKDGSNIYIRTNETMTLRVLEVPTVRPVNQKKYYNFKNMMGFHSKRNSDGTYLKTPCSNPYKSKEVYCDECNKGNTNISREYVVDAQVFESHNGRDSDGTDADFLEYDQDTSYTLKMQSSMATAVTKKFEEMQKAYGVSVDDFPKIMFTVKKVKGDPWYVVERAEIRHDIPIPSVTRFNRADNQVYTPYGADNGSIYTSSTPPVYSGVSIDDFTPAERENIITMADMIQSVMTEGNDVTVADVRDHMLKSIGITAKDEKAKEEKVEWALTNMFDKQWNLRMKL